MLKKPFLIIIAFVMIVSMCIASAMHFLKPLLKEKFLEIAEAGLGTGILLSEFDVSLARGIVFLRGIRVENCKLIKYRNSISADEIILDVDLPSSLFKRNLVLQEIHLKNFSFDFNNKEKPSPSYGESQAPKQALPSTKEIAVGPEEPGVNISTIMPAKRPDALYVRKILIENSNFLFADYSVSPSPNIIKITGLNCRIKELSLPSDGILKGYISLEGRLNSRYEGLLKLDGSFAKNEKDIDFDFNLLLNDVNLTRFSPYYADTSLTILKDAKLDLTSNAKCLKNRLNAKQSAHIYDIKLYEIKPANEDTLFGLPAKTVMDFFRDLRGDIEFDFSIAGTIDNPKFEFGPLIQQVLAKALHDKIVAKLQGLPREVIKMSEKAISENLGRVNKINISDGDEIKEALKDVSKELKKIIPFKP